MAAKSGVRCICSTRAGRGRSALELTVRPCLAAGTPAVEWLSDFTHTPILECIHVLANLLGKMCASQAMLTRSWPPAALRAAQHPNIRGAVQSTATEPQSTARRDQLLGIQAAAQQRWAESKVFEADAPAAGEDAPEGRWTGNFPYPYMNGVLHLGHAFSISKVEMAAAFHRVCGKRVLFPQGFHCTGARPCPSVTHRLQLGLPRCAWSYVVLGTVAVAPSTTSSRAPSKSRG